MQNFFRNLIPESNFLYAEHVLNGNKLDAIDVSMANLIHDPYGVDLSDLPWDIKSLLVLRDPIRRIYSDFKMITRWNPRQLSRDQEVIYKFAMQGVLPFFSSKNPIINGSLYNIIY